MSVTKINPVDSSWSRKSSDEVQAAASKLDWLFPYSSSVDIMYRDVTRTVTDSPVPYARGFYSRKFESATDFLNQSTPYEFSHHDEPRLYQRSRGITDPRVDKRFRSVVYKETRMAVSCRKCSECLNARSKELAIQSTMESRSCQDSCVLILTYANEHLGDNVLNIDHVTSFRKRLRRYVDYHYGKKLKFLTVGEYGDKKGRMHWHMIVFGWKPSEAEGLKTYFGGKFGNQPRKISTKLNDLWGKGYVDVDVATPGNIFYVSRYVQKKFVKGADLDSGLKDEREKKEIKTSSRGLGLKYFFDNLPTLLRTQRVSLNGFSYTIPRSYRDLLRKLLSRSEDYDTPYYNELRKKVFSICSPKKIREFFEPLVAKIRPCISFHELYRRALKYMDTPLLKPHEDDHDHEVLYFNTS